MVKRLKKSTNINIANFNKIKKSCIVVKSNLTSFIYGLIIALSFKENVNCAYVKKNDIFKLKDWQRKYQPKTIFKTLSNKLTTDASKFLTFIPVKIKHWRTFLNYLGFNLVIYCAKSHYKIINERYLGKNSFFRDIFLVKSDNDFGTKYHYDVIRKPNGYFGKFICKLCYKSGKSLLSHICKNRCFMCKSQVQHDKQLTIRTSYCKKCHRYFYNKSCKNIHIRNKVCERKKICLKCDNLFIVKKKKEHKCYSKDYCKFCKCIHPPRKHFIKSGFKPPPDCEFILIFDFETFNNVNNVVTPYLCISRLYNIKEIYNQKSEVSFSDCDYEEKVFYGVDCGRDFFIYLTNGLVPKKTICFAHNGQAFDFYFILKHFYLNPYFIPSLIFNGSRLMQMIVKNKNIELKFIDSLNFIPFPLRKFPNIFGFADSKSFFPYSFVNFDTLHYFGPMPQKKFFDINPADEKEFDDFYYRDSIKYQQQWSVKDVSIEYCKQDVHVLFCGVFTYLKSFYKVAKINPFT